MQCINAQPMNSSTPSNIALVGFGVTVNEVSPAILNHQRSSDARGRRSGVVDTVPTQPCRPHAQSPAGAVYARQ